MLLFRKYIIFCSQILKDMKYLLRNGLVIMKLRYNTE